MNTSRIPLLPDKTYHVFNRAIGDEMLFTSNDNYRFFLEKYRKYIIPIANTYCFCLMPNHFHILLKIKEDKIIAAFFNNAEEKLNLQKSISQQFSNFFNAYTKAFNNQNNRRGSLFMRPFKRKVIKDEQYLRKVVHYIHYNPIKAKLVNKPDEWKYSSYNTLICHKSTKLSRNEVIAWFDGVSNFIFCHSHPPTETGLDKFT